MTLLKKIWVFLAEISGVIATITYAILGMSHVWGLVTKNNWLLIAFSFALILTILSSIRWILATYHKYSQKLIDIEISNELYKFKNTRLSNNIDKLLPNNNLLNNLDKLLRKKIINWSEDVRIDSITLYLSIGNDKKDLTIQAHCISTWKNEEAYIYAGNDYDNSLNEIIGEIPNNSGNLVPFYIKHPEWREAVTKAYKSVNDILPDKFKLIVRSHHDDVLRFEFSYTSGINKKEIFEMYKNTLTNLKTKKEITL